MDPLEALSRWLVFDVLHLQGQFGEAAAFFCYDVPKVLLLLAAMVFLVSIIRTYATPKKIKALLGKNGGLRGNILAALLGVPTPFCSCSAVPIFIGLVDAGVPLGVTFSFLISSPMVNEVAIGLLFGMFGWQITALYIVSGLVIAIVAGYVIGRMRLEKEVEKFDLISLWGRGKREPKTMEQRIEFAKCQMWEITKSVAPYVVFGIAVGAFIHGYVPADFLANVAGKSNPLAVPVAVAVGVPLYSNAAGVIPIVDALISKGMALGTALAFMMSVTALSLPEMIILRKVIKPKLIAIFALVLAVSITFTGLLFNAVIG
ncbi:putative permease [Candidatus Norongarragalina meridionalis]|nr:putative permease [Candidatus Norongarragalina meridionalis]